MIYLRCECGNGTGVPGSFIGESVPCEDCGKSLRLVAAAEVSDEQSATSFIDIRNVADESIPPERVFLAGASPIIVGKAVGAHLPLAGSLVSRTHCRFVPVDTGGWNIEDTNSRNGLFVNGARVASHALRSGDAIRVGEYELKYSGISVDALEEIPAGVAEPASPFDDPDNPFDEYELSEPIAPPPAPPTRVPGVVDPMNALGPGPTCPSCAKTLMHGAKICVDCGIDVKTGRALLTAQGLDEDFLHVRAENTIRLISWIIPFGLYPVASEARGHKRPYAVWSIAAATLVASVVFFFFAWTAPKYELPKGSNFMLWVGDAHAEPDEDFDLDDDSASVAQITQNRRRSERSLSDQDRKEIEKILEQIGRRARPTEEFHVYQLLTHALLHADILHIAGNMLFLLVFGTRVNALVGNLIAGIVYPVLAIAGGIGHMLASRHESPSPMLGASGAIMGLAGMYFVLFPAYKVHVAIWMRFGIFTGFKLAWKLFAVRGFWVVLFYIAFDVLATVLGSKDGVAHWAHLGGFITGAVLALVLILTRLVNAHGGDILSVLLGRRAWLILGKPGGPLVSSTVAGAE